VSGLDFLSPAARHELELFIEARVEEILRRRRPERRFVSVREAAALLGITERALRGRIERGRVPVRHQGRSVLVDLAALDRSLD
jgi:excisionase family DNA binding protein